jgi:hypothetical protein
LACGSMSSTASMRGSSNTASFRWATMRMLANTKVNPPRKAIPVTNVMRLEKAIGLMRCLIHSRNKATCKSQCRCKAADYWRGYDRNQLGRKINRQGGIKLRSSKWIRVESPTGFLTPNRTTTKLSINFHALRGEDYTRVTPDIVYDSQNCNAATWRCKNQRSMTMFLANQ